MPEERIINRALDEMAINAIARQQAQNIFAAQNNNPILQGFTCRVCGGNFFENEGLLNQFGHDFVCTADFLNLARALGGFGFDTDGELMDRALSGHVFGNDGDFTYIKKQQEDKNFEAGEIITSKRTFGLEFEINLGRQGQHALRESIAKEFQMVRDGSVNSGIEVVSPILKGKEGEDKIKHVCKAMQTVKAGADESCGLHVHIGAEDLFKKSELSIFSIARYCDMIETNDMSGYKLYVLSPDLMKELRDQNYALYEAIYANQYLDTFSIDEFLSYIKTLSIFDVVFAGKVELEEKNLKYVVATGSRGARIKISDAIMSEADLKSYTGEPVAINMGYSHVALIDRKTSQNLFIVSIPKNHEKESATRLNKIKRLAAFCVAFDDVFAAMLPCDRRDNDFAIRASTRLAIRDIHQCRTILDFFNAWTKTRNLREFRLSMNEARHESRYYGINFRALLKHGTFEVRYHAGTTDSDKALYWTAMFQKIVDIAANLEDKRFGVTFKNNTLDLGCLEKASMVVDIERKADLFFSKIQLPKKTEQYLRKRIKEFAAEDKNFVDYLIADDNQQ